MNNKPHILVVDDDISWRENLEEAFGNKHSVHLAGSLLGAKDALNRRFCHVAIVDLRLNGNNVNEGMEVLKYIEGLDEGTSPFVISGYADASMYDDFRRMGVSSVTDKNTIIKGESIDKIRAKVEKAASDAWSKAIRQQWHVSPFGVLRGLFAREIQQDLRAGPMTELRPFLSSLVRPLYPWLQAKREAVSIKDKDEQNQILAFEVLCWSRALGQAVVVRFGRVDGFRRSLEVQPLGLVYGNLQIENEPHFVSRSHFEGAVYRIKELDFDKHFNPPPLKKNSTPPSS